MTNTQQNLATEAAIAITEGNFTEWLTRLNDCDLRLLQHTVLPELAASVAAVQVERQAGRICEQWARIAR